MPATATRHEQDALNELSAAFHRLVALGWKDSQHAPCDGHTLELIEVGSTGIHEGYRDADRRFWIIDALGTVPSRPALFRIKRR